jgi:hypothetical protein
VEVVVVDGTTASPAADGTRPSTNQIARTGESPAFASRCGIVESNEIASPGSRM